MMFTKRILCISICTSTHPSCILLYEIDALIVLERSILQQYKDMPGQSQNCSMF